MFGEYAQIASFLSPRDSYGNIYNVDAMPDHLRPVYHPPQPWATGREKSGLTEDFIMIAEFSELEGPKPLMTIPKEGAGLGFDQNSFAVRILAVDHQNSSSQGFTISEDAQVVLSDVDAGVFAFVHHLVLYDNTARGFVRPHCIAYITTDQRKLMVFYEEMSCKFKKVARYIKYGNLMLFVADLERHLKDLEHTKGFLLNQVSKQRLKDGETNSDMRKNADNELHRKLQSIHQSNSEIKDILSILKPLLSDRRLEARFRLLEERAFHGNSLLGGDKLSLQENWFNDLSSLDGLDSHLSPGGSLRDSHNSPLSLFKPRDYKPLLVETKKAKRFNAPLRGLHELCSWGAKEGLKKLRSLYSYFKRDMVLLELEKMESKLMRPACASIYHGHCVTGNLLAGIHMKQHSSSLDEEEEFSLLQQYPAWASSTSLESTDSFKSADSFSSAWRVNNASPGSGHTTESINGHLFQSAPSSLDKNDISLLMEDEYYEQYVERDKGGEKESDCSINKESNYANRSSGEEAFLGDAMKEIKQRIDAQSDDLDKPPVLVFKETIKRPLSVVSLGCTDNEHDNNSEKEGLTLTPNNITVGCSETTPVLKNKETNGSTSSTHSSEQDRWGVGDNVNVCNQPIETKDREIQFQRVGSWSSSASNNSMQAGNSSSTNSSANNTFPREIPSLHSSNNSLKDCDKNISATIGIRKFHRDSPTALSSSCDSNFTHTKQSNSPSNKYSSSDLIKPSRSSPANSSPTNSNMGKPIPNHNNNKTTLGMLTSSALASSPISSSLSSTPSQQLDSVFEEDNNNDKRGKTTGNNFFQDNRKYSNSPSSSSSSLILKQPPPRLSSSPAASCGIQRQISVTTSSITSDFTDISMRDLFPYLTDVDPNDGSLPPDMQSAYSSGETIDPNCTTENFNNGNNGVSISAWRPRHGLYTVGDWLSNINRGHTGYGILEILNGYNNFQHVVYSLMIGRPVLVVGVSKLEPEVLKIINALAVFIPSTKRRQQYVLEWTSKHLRISDLSKLRLIGLCRDERKSLDSFVPSAVKKASTVIDVEKRTIFAPHYQGQLILGLLTKKKTLKNDAVMLSYIHWWLMDILGKAFIFFHSFYLGSAGTMMSSVNLREHRDSYRATVNGIMGRLGVKDSDCSIVEYLAELTKQSRLESKCNQKQESDATIQPLSIQYTPCQTFKC